MQSFLKSSYDISNKQLSKYLKKYISKDSYYRLYLEPMIKLVAKINPKIKLYLNKYNINNVTDISRSMYRDFYKKIYVWYNECFLNTLVENDDISNVYFDKASATVSSNTYIYNYNYAPYYGDEYKETCDDNNKNALKIKKNKRMPLLGDTIIDLKLGVFTNKKENVVYNSCIFYGIVNEFYKKDLFKKQFYLNICDSSVLNTEDDITYRNNNINYIKSKFKIIACNIVLYLNDGPHKYKFDFSTMNFGIHFNSSSFNYKNIADFHTKYFNRIRNNINTCEVNDNNKIKRFKRRKGPSSDQNAYFKLNKLYNNELGDFNVAELNSYKWTSLSCKPKKL